MQPKRQFIITLPPEYNSKPRKQQASSHLRAAELFAARYWYESTVRALLNVRRVDGDPKSDGHFEPVHKGNAIAPPFFVQES